MVLSLYCMGLILDNRGEDVTKVDCGKIYCAFVPHPPSKIELDGGNTLTVLSSLLLFP